jgi:dTDP-4-amino-4,6-dideoxygalactose transaminase
MRRASFYDLPPAGHPVIVREGGVPPAVPGYRTVWLESGTAALSLALILARRMRADLSRPEVVIPAYGCPDLVAAAVYSGLVPVLVDIGEDDPAFDVSALEAAFSENTVAVIAVNFLGIRERLTEIRTLLARQGQVALIEDNAQWWPEPAEAPGLVGDFVCVSFARGKPVTLLGGGGLMVAESLWLRVEALLPRIEEAPARAAFSVAVRIYNTLLKPSWYWIVNRNPLIHLGTTVYRPLGSIRAMDPRRQELLQGNIDEHVKRGRDPEVWLRKALAHVVGVTDVALAAADRSGRLLRFPVLFATQGVRQAALAELRRAGLGATALYGVPLPEIAGVAERVTVPAPCPGAARFSSRLLTLPVHAAVTEHDVSMMTRIIAKHVLPAGS